MSDILMIGPEFLSSTATWSSNPQTSCLCFRFSFLLQGDRPSADLWRLHNLRTSTSMNRYSVSLYAILWPESLKCCNLIPVALPFILFWGVRYLLFNRNSFYATATFKESLTSQNASVHIKIWCVSIDVYKDPAHFQRVTLIVKADILW